MSARRDFVVLNLLLAGCGARSGLEVPPKHTAPDATAIDGALDATDTSIDAGPDVTVDADASFDGPVGPDASFDTRFETPDTPDPADTADVLTDAIEDVLVLDAPRPIAPLSTMRTTTRRPTFRWINASGETSARVEICASRACSTILTSFDTTGASARAPSELPPGIVFWRLRTIRPGAVGLATSAVWEIVIPNRSAPIESASGALADFDGDGLGDVAVVVTGLDDGIRVRVHPAAAASASFDALLAMPSEFDTPAMAVAPAGDLDGDGVGDLVVAADDIYVFRGPPSSARPPTIIPAKLGAREGLINLSSAGDVDGDGYGDLVFSVQSRDVAYVELHRGGPAGVDPIASWRYDAVSGGLYAGVSGSCDFDADGFSDFVIPRSTHSILYRGGPAGPTLFSTTVGPTALRVCANDVDGDGYADFWGRGLDPTDTSLIPFLFHGAPSGPHAPQPFLMADTTELSSGADFDGDGFLDLVVRNGDGSIYLSKGAPIVGPYPTERLSGPYPPGFAEHVAALGDVDGDGYGDAAFTGEAYVFILRGSPTGFGAPPWTPWKTIDETAIAVRVEAIATSR